MKKWIFNSIEALIVLGLLVTIVILVQNDFKITERKVEIKTSTGVLKGTLVLPKQKKLPDKLGLVVFIHGDGPANASYDEKYKPLWEKLALQGYASLSWSKPGIEGSSGNWLLQSMEDRAKEADEVIQWAKTLPEIDQHRIGLWGASQAGWVVPKIVQLNKEIAFTILVAPAINWIDQGRYNTLKELEKKGATKEEINQKDKEFARDLELFKKGTSYEEYVNIVGKKRAVTADRWIFITKNYKADATEDIKRFYSPVKLILGGRDINVDSNNTKEIYQQKVAPELLSVTVIPTADHSMLKPSLVDSEVLTFFTAVFCPRQLADRQYYREIEQFLKGQEKK